MANLLDKDRLRDIKLAFLLFSPIAIFYLGYFFNHSDYLIPTGYIQYDNIGYSAYAKQYLDGGTNGIFYNNPFNESGDYQAIYFQTQNFFLVLLMKLGASPAAALCLFSCVCCILAIYAGIKIYDLFAGSGSWRLLSILLLTWGGGILVLVSTLSIPLQPSQDIGLANRLFYLDPAGGWWGLNFGRPLIFGVEAYYHLLFLTAVLLTLTKRWKTAVIVSLILSCSHPFTGIHLLLVLLLYTGIELIFTTERKPLYWFGSSLFLLVLLHLGYYLVLLPTYPDHKTVGEQYSANWNYKFYHFMPAYALVMILSVVSFVLTKSKIFFSLQHNRFLIALAIVSFLLSNHEWFVKPMQPIHFARGYEWLSYFLMGIPALHLFLNRFSNRRLIFSIFVLIFLFDNIMWFTRYTLKNVDKPSTSYITKEQKNLLSSVQQHSDSSTLIVGFGDLPYLSTVYTQSYPWASHPYTTPNYEYKMRLLDSFMRTGNAPSEWSGRPLLLIFDKTDSIQLNRSKHLGFSAQLLLESKNYVVTKGRIDP